MLVGAFDAVMRGGHRPLTARALGRIMLVSWAELPVERREHCRIVTGPALGGLTWFSANLECPIGLLSVQLKAVTGVPP